MPLFALERVTLSNGFSMACDHHVASDGRVRLYTAKTGDSYIEVSSTEIAKIEDIPDAPPSAATPPAATSPQATLSSGELHEMLSAVGQDHDLDVDLLASVVKAESGGNVRALSRSGAQGLMQLMPGTAAGLGVKDTYEPHQNVRGGTAYLDQLLQRYHNNVALALAAYNAGPAAVDRYHGIPPYRETRVYVARVIREFNRRVLERQHALTAGSALSTR